MKYLLNSKRLELLLNLTARIIIYTVRSFKLSSDFYTLLWYPCTWVVKMYMMVKTQIVA